MKIFINFTVFATLKGGEIEVTPSFFLETVGEKMVHIELRQDLAWFAAVKDFLEEYPYYRAKQNLKDALDSIGEQPTFGELEKELSKIFMLSPFKGNPYLIGDEIYIDTYHAVERSYLGRIEQ